MIRAFLGWALTIAKRIFDDTVPEDKLHSFLRQGLQDLYGALQRGDRVPNHLELRSILEAVERLQKQGLEGFPPFVVETDDVQHEPRAFESLQPVVSKGLIDINVIHGLSLVMDLDRSFDEPRLTQMEILLRHVEVRRQTALAFTQSGSEDARWRAVTQTSSLFSRFAMHQKDFRFLNAALKLNDWAYRYYRKRRALIFRLPYLCALLEAEATLLELTN